MLGKSSLWSVVAPEVVGLADRLNEPCSISVLEGLDILFVCRDSTRRIHTARLGVGDRLPAHCTASGKVLLGSLPIADLDKRLKGVQLASFGPASITQTSSLKSALKDVRAKGFATAIDEMEDGTLSIAVPIKERSGRTIAAMSVATHRSRKTPADLTKSVLPALRLAVEAIQGTVQDFQDRNWTVF